MVLPDRFWDKIQMEPNSGCWLWDGYCNNFGYGYIRVGSKMVRAHRFSYEKFKGEIPEGKVIDHLCRVRCCVNPEHLEVVTQRENSRRGNTGQNMSCKTHCPRDHPYDEVNTYVNPSGSRNCRICMAQATKRWREKRQELANE